MNVVWCMIVPAFRSLLPASVSCVYLQSSTVDYTYTRTRVDKPCTCVCWYYNCIKCYYTDVLINSRYSLWSPATQTASRPTCSRGKVQDLQGGILSTSMTRHDNAITTHVGVLSLYQLPRGAGATPTSMWPHQRIRCSRASAGLRYDLCTFYRVIYGLYWLSDVCLWPWPLYSKYAALALLLYALMIMKVPLHSCGRCPS